MVIGGAETDGAVRCEPERELEAVVAHALEVLFCRQEPPAGTRPQGGISSAVRPAFPTVTSLIAFLNPFQKPVARAEKTLPIA